uniref:Uncharacterized protein n=1 Tax=Plectus sambesii TaxID=2011161 RepID=A0A914VJ45_9BILA
MVEQQQRPVEDAEVQSTNALGSLTPVAIVAKRALNGAKSALESTVVSRAISFRRHEPAYDLQRAATGRRMPRLLPTIRRCRHSLDTRGREGTGNGGTQARYQECRASSGQECEIKNATEQEGIKRHDGGDRRRQWTEGGIERGAKEKATIIDGGEWHQGKKRVDEDGGMRSVGVMAHATGERTALFIIDSDGDRSGGFFLPAGHQQGRSGQETNATKAQVRSLTKTGRSGTADSRRVFIPLSTSGRNYAVKVRQRRC